MIENSVQDFFENIYENTLRKGQSISPEMGEYIQQEIEKMNKQKEEWLKNQPVKKD